MEKPHSCGEGLAEHAAVPAKLADLMASLADNLELHAGALLEDENARVEHAAYVTLLTRARDVAVALRSLGDQMASSRDLPMGGHDLEKLSSPDAVHGFERYVDTVRSLIALLQDNNTRNEQMLGGMRGRSPSR
jgi:hypothetical protein